MKGGLERERGGNQGNGKGERKGRGRWKGKRKGNWDTGREMGNGEKGYRESGQNVFRPSWGVGAKGRGKEKGERGEERGGYREGKREEKEG